MATDYDRAKYPNLDSDKKDIDKSEATEKADAKARSRGESNAGKSAKEKPVVKA